MMKEEYYKPKSVTLVLCECDKDMIGYALSHVDWSEYNPEDFCGEDVMAAGEHFNDILSQLDRD